MIVWVKPNGAEVQTNEEVATILMAESLDWKRKKGRKKLKKEEQKED